MRLCGAGDGAHHVQSSACRDPCRAIGKSRVEYTLIQGVSVLYCPADGRADKAVRVLCKIVLIIK